MNINSSIVFKIRLFYYVNAVLTLNQFHVSCSTVLFTTMIILSTITNIDCKLLENTYPSLTKTLLYGNSSLDINIDSLIVNAPTDFILPTKRFEGLNTKNLKFKIDVYSVFSLKINQKSAIQLIHIYIYIYIGIYIRYKTNVVDHLMIG